MEACHAHVHIDRAPPPIAPAVGLGLLGAAGLLTLYFGLLTMLSGWAFTLDQFREFWPYIVALAVGFGVQVGLFATLHRATHADHSGKVVAVTGTTSGVAMISCCTHYLVSLLPALGATGLVALVGEYQRELFWFGLAANLAGILYMGRKVVTLCRVASAISVAGLMALAAPLEAAAQALPAATDRQGQVTVQVTPVAWALDGWTFEVVFDTHVVALDHDLLAVAVLSTPDGRAQRPSSWRGDPPGGHHRKGLLVFPPLTPTPPSVSLTIRDVGPVPERTFSWSLTSR